MGRKKKIEERTPATIEDVINYGKLSRRKRAEGGFKNNYGRGASETNVTYTVKEKVADFINLSMDEFRQSFANLDDKDKCDVIVKMMQYVIPRVSEQTLNANVKTDSVQDELAKLAGTTLNADSDRTYDN